MKLFIAIPSMDRVHSEFMMSMIHLQQTLFNRPVVPEMGLSIVNQRGSLIQGSREDLVRAALDAEATHILFIDSDMTFPDDLFHRLFAHNLPAVACNYVQRIIPARSNARDENGVELLTYSDSTGLEKARSAGFGACLIWADVFKRLSLPWFDVVWLEKEKGPHYYPDTLDLLGEDVFLFKKMKHELDVDLYIDHDLSKEIGHIGDFEYTNNLAEIV